MSKADAQAYLASLSAERRQAVLACKSIAEAFDNGDRYLIQDYVTYSGLLRWHFRGTSGGFWRRNEVRDMSKTENPWLKFGIYERFFHSTIFNYNPRNKFEAACRKAAENYVADADAPKHKGAGILFHGPTKRGKTHLLVGILKEYNRLGQSIRYMSIEEFYVGLRQAIDEHGQTEARYIERIAAVDVLALDDLHALKDREGYQYRTLWDLMDLRFRRMKRTITASNKSPAALIAAFDERLLGRFQAIQWAISEET